MITALIITLIEFISRKKKKKPVSAPSRVRYGYRIPEALWARKGVQYGKYNDIW